jgi:transcriptional regulator with XRE-family HTH domain
LDFLQKLNYLMEKNNLNKSTLSKACDIPYTTIDGWYKKGYEGLKLTTLRKLANYFGTSLDFWANEIKLEHEITQNNNQECLGEKLKKAPEPAMPKSGTSKSKDDIFEKLYNTLIEAGIVKPGQDISSQQADILIAVIKILRAAFNENDQSV